ncbi:hypothetical protein psal_cds_548 [Pandoravirus salinus]|uniref:Uncharacterized protein n=1 Tax=Pandoravirus salinus TaxID=1349410 RepID=S4W1T2_9VIRU|nr:hypothetical protein psal_cds_548 [Pandoravirus salinus]AGO84392.1 hypothetical protein psal_cds_548 [Pandoravirus salinus]
MKRTRQIDNDAERAPEIVRASKRPAAVLPQSIDRAARVCAQPVGAHAEDVEAVVEAARFYGAPVPSPWSLNTQCDALEDVAGSPWSSAVNARRVTSRQARFGVSPALPPGVHRETHASPPQPHYEEALPPDIQYQIMQFLAENRPGDALALASASASQRSLLGGIPTSRLALSHGFGLRQGTPTGTALDYVHSVAALGAADSPTAIVLAQALCLMQAFARFHFRDPANLEVDMRAYYQARPYGDFNRDAAREISMLDSLGIIQPVEGRRVDPILVHDWYRWLMAASDRDFALAARGSPLLDRWQTATGGAGRRPVLTVSTVEPLVKPLAIGDALVVGPTLPGRGNPRMIRELPREKLAEILDASAARPMGTRVSADDVGAWMATGDRSALLPAVLASPQAKDAFESYLDAQVAAEQRGRCLDFETATGLALPRFTSLLDVDFYVTRFGQWPLWGLWVALRSPRLESLLASVGAWPPART